MPLETTTGEFQTTSPPRTTLSPGSLSTVCPPIEYDPYEYVSLRLTTYSVETSTTVQAYLNSSCSSLFSYYIVNFGDSTTTTEYDVLSDIRHEYTAPGTYYVTMTAMDVFGNANLYNSPSLEVYSSNNDHTTVEVCPPIGIVPFLSILTITPDPSFNYETLQIYYGDGTTQIFPKDYPFTPAKDLPQVCPESNPFDILTPLPYLRYWQDGTPPTEPESTITIHLSHVWEIDRQLGELPVITILTDSEGNTKYEYHTSVLAASSYGTLVQLITGGNIRNRNDLQPFLFRIPNVPNVPIPGVSATTIAPPPWVTTPDCEVCYPEVPTTPLPPPFTLPTTVKVDPETIELTTPAPIDPLTPQIITTTPEPLVVTTTTQEPIIMVPVLPEPCPSNCKSLKF